MGNMKNTKKLLEKNKIEKSSIEEIYKISTSVVEKGGDQIGEDKER